MYANTFCGQFSPQLKKHVTVRLNGNVAMAKDMYIEEGWTWEEFLAAAATRLGISKGAVKRAFHSDGEELDDCMMILDDDVIIISEGDALEASFENFSGECAKKVRLYTVEKLLGTGGFGDVYSGKNSASGQTVALKFIKRSSILDLYDAQRTLSEVRMLQLLNHRNIIQFLSYIEAHDELVFVLELMEGGDLRDHLLSRGPTPAQVALSEDEARGVFSQIISGLNYAHAHNVIHRDLKLENILLSKAGSLKEVKIADFGLAEICSSSKLTVAGTTSFMAPELLQDSASDGAKLDIWAAGVVLFALLCGRLPFDGSDLTYEDRPAEAVVETRIINGTYNIDAQLSNGAKNVIKSMMSQDYDERPTTTEVLHFPWLQQMSQQLAREELAVPTTQKNSEVPSRTMSFHESLADVLDDYTAKESSVLTSVESDSSLSSSASMLSFSLSSLSLAKNASTSTTLSPASTTAATIANGSNHSTLKDQLDAVLRRGSCKGGDRALVSQAARKPSFVSIGSSINTKRASCPSIYEPFGCSALDTKTTGDFEVKRNLRRKSSLQFIPLTEEQQTSTVITKESMSEKTVRRK